MLDNTDHPLIDLFNYSEDEWSKIAAATQSIRTGALPDEIRAELIGWARVYLARMAHSAPIEHRRWVNIARQACRLEQALSDAVELNIQFLRKCGSEEKDLTSWDMRRELETLSEIALLANAMADTTQREPSDLRHFNSPRLMYEWEILEIWVQLGGRLGISRHPRTGKVQGPLARFFRAVTVPVMGASAPALETLRDAIARHEKIRRSRLIRDL
jgi:hypothetical protein